MIRETVPAALIKPCPAKKRGALKTTGDLVNRLVATEAALSVCASQIEGIRQWNEASHD